MIGHRTFTVLFLFLLVLLLITDQYGHVRTWVFFALPAIYLSGVMYGSFNIASGYHVKAICSGNTDQREVSLTFDDGPDPEVTPKVLDLLKERGAKATFFVIGEKAAQHPSLLKRIHEEGHLIGGHSWSHGFWFDLSPTWKMEREMKKTETAIIDAIGHRPRYFRPPYGVTTPKLRRAVEKRAYEVIGWDVRSLDTSGNEEKSFRRVKKGVVPGSIILFHDTNEIVVGILQRLLDHLPEKGLQVASLDHIIEKPAYEKE